MVARRSAFAWLCCVCMVVGATCAQQADVGVQLRVELAADPEREGPPAWTYLRERAFAIHRPEGVASAQDALVIDLVFEIGGAISVRDVDASTVSLPKHLYLRGRLEVREDGVPSFVVAGDCTIGGHARVRGVSLPEVLETESAASRLVVALGAVVGVHDSTVLVGVEVPALCGVAASVGGARLEGHLVASWCGTVDAVCDLSPGEVDAGDVFSCAAISDGGLLLPLALLLQAVPSIHDRIAADAVEEARLRAALGSRPERFTAALHLALMRDKAEGPDRAAIQNDLEILRDYGEGFASFAAHVATVDRKVAGVAPKEAGAWRGIAIGVFATTSLLFAVLIARAKKA